jgi:hypothetical protein
MTYQTGFSSRGREERVQGRPGPPVVRQGAQERADRLQPGCRSCPRARQIQNTCIKGTVSPVFAISGFFSSDSALPLGLRTKSFYLVILLMKIYRSQGRRKISLFIDVNDNYTLL